MSTAACRAGGLSDSRRVTAPVGIYVSGGRNNPVGVQNETALVRYYGTGTHGIFRTAIQIPDIDTAILNLKRINSNPVAQEERFGGGRPFAG